MLLFDGTHTFSYETARAKVESIFGPRTHRDFPGQIRLSGQGCSGNGLYPSSLEKPGVDEYNHTGLDLSISNGENVSLNCQQRFIAEEFFFDGSWNL